MAALGQGVCRPSYPVPTLVWVPSGTSVEGWAEGWALGPAVPPMGWTPGSGPHPGCFQSKPWVQTLPCRPFSIGARGASVWQGDRSANSRFKWA